MSSFAVSPEGYQDLVNKIAKLKGVNVEQAMAFLNGRGFANKAQWDLINRFGGAKGVLQPGLKGAAAKLAGKGLVHTGLRAVPLIGAGLAAYDVADVVTNDTTLGNKTMDAGAMLGGLVKGATAGATAGSVVPGLGTAAGAIVGGLGGLSLGKMGSDSLQWLFGDKMTKKEREMQRLLEVLKSGVV